VIDAFSVCQSPGLVENFRVGVVPGKIGSHRDKAPGQEEEYCCSGTKRHNIGRACTSLEVKAFLFIISFWQAPSAGGNLLQIGTIQPTNPICMALTPEFASGRRPELSRPATRLHRDALYLCNLWLFIVSIRISTNLLD